MKNQMKNEQRAEEAWQSMTKSTCIWLSPHWDMRLARMHLPTRSELLRGPGTPSDRPIHSLNKFFGKHKSLTATSQHSSPEGTRRWDLQSLAMIGMVPTPVPEHSGDRQGDLKFKVRLSDIVRFYLKNMRWNKIKWRPWQGISPVRLCDSYQ